MENNKKRYCIACKEVWYYEEIDTHLAELISSYSRTAPYGIKPEPCPRCEKHALEPQDD